MTNNFLICLLLLTVSGCSVTKTIGHRVPVTFMEGPEVHGELWDVGVDYTVVNGDAVNGGSVEVTTVGGSIERKRSIKNQSLHSLKLGLGISSKIDLKATYALSLTSPDAIPMLGLKTQLIGESANKKSPGLKWSLMVLAGAGEANSGFSVNSNQGRIEQSIRAVDLISIAGRRFNDRWVAYVSQFFSYRTVESLSTVTTNSIDRYEVDLSSIHYGIVAGANYSSDSRRILKLEVGLANSEMVEFNDSSLALHAGVSYGWLW